MTLAVLTVAEMKAHSALAEVQALSDGTLEPLEAQALDLLEAELGRRLTLDSTNVARTVAPNRLTVLPLPERLNSISSVVVASQVDVTARVGTTCNGWLLEAVYPHTYHWRHPVTITGKWGITCPAPAKRVLMDVVEALAVRKGDPISRRDELAPWGAATDGALRVDRESSVDRRATLENLLRYDLKKRLAGYYRPQIVAVI